MGTPTRFHAAIYTTLLAISVIHCQEPPRPPPQEQSSKGASSSKVGDVKEFMDVDGLEDISCEQSLAFGGQKSRLLDNPAKVAKFESTLRLEYQIRFQTIKRQADKFDISIFTAEDMRSLLGYLHENMNQMEFDNSLNAKQFLQSAAPPEISALMKKWTPAFRLLQDPNFMCDVNKMIKLGAFGILCEHLRSFDTTVKQMSVMEDRCAHCTAYFVSQREDEQMTGVLHGGKGRVLYKLIRKTYEDDWDLHMLRLDPGSVRVDDIQRIDAAHFSDRTQLETVLTNEDIWMHLGRKVMAAIGEALLTALGPLGTWPSVDLEMYAPYIMCLPPKRLGKVLTPQMFFDIDMELLDIPRSNMFFKTGVWKVVDYFQDTANKQEFHALPTKAKLICLILKFAPMKSLFNSLITIDMAKDALMECMDVDIKHSKLSFLLKKITKAPEWGWTSDELLQIDLLMPLLPSFMLDNITDDDLMNYWSNKMAAFNFPLTKAIMTRLKEKFQFKKFKCEQMEILQEGILTLTKEDLDLIPLPVYSRCAASYLPYLDRNCHYSPKVCEYIWRLIKRSGKMTNVDMLDLMQNMTGAFVEDFVPPQDMSDIEVDPDTDLELEDMPMDGPHARVLYDKMKGKMGNTSMHERGSNLDSGRKKSDALKFFGRGSTVEDLRDMSEDGSFMNVLPEIASDVGKDNRKKTSVVYDKLHDVLGMDGMTDDDVCIEDEMTEDLAGFFTQASQDDLDKLKPESKKGILRAIGEEDEYVQQMNRPKLRNFFKEQLESTGKDGKESISPEDVEEVGRHLFCGMTKEDARKLNPDAVTEYIKTFEQCDQLDQDTRGELTSSYVQANGGLKKMLRNPAQIQELESLFSYIDMDLELTEIEKEKLKMVSDEVQSSFSRRQERLEDRPGRDIPDEEKDAEKSKRSDFNKKMMRLASDNRDGEGMDCAQLRTFEGELDFLDVEDIKQMPLPDFKDCLEDFHLTHWNEKQLAAIGHKLKRLFGKDTSMWAANVTMRAGPLIAALDHGDIAQLKLDEDILAYLGLFDAYGEKASVIAKRFMKYNAFHPEEMPADLLASLGQLICGLNPDMILKLNATALLEAASHFADVECLDDDQLDAIMTQLKEELGSDWSDMPAFAIEEMGVLMGGADEDILKSLEEEQLASVDGRALEKVPPRRFAKAFDADKLKQLSDEQTMYLKPEHMWRMDATQREVMSNFTREDGIPIPTATHKGRQESSSKDFQKGRNLPRSSCGSSLAFAGQTDNLLNNKKKVSAFQKTLSGKTFKFFKELLASEDHSIDQFTADEMGNTLEFLMETISDEDREDFMSIHENFQFISQDTLRKMLQEWPPKIHLLQKPEAMCGMTEKLDGELLKTFCDRLADSDVTAAVTAEVMERCADCVVLRQLNRQNYRHMSRLEDAKASVVMKKLRQMEVRDWDLYFFAIAPEGLKPDDVDMVEDISHFRDETELEVFQDDDVSCCLEKGVKRKIAGKLRKALGPLNTWSEEVREKVGQFVPYLDDSVVDSELTGDVVMKNLKHMKPGDDEELGPEQEKTFTKASWKLAEHLSRHAESISKEDKMKSFCLLAKFPPKQDIFDSIYDTDEMKEGLRNCSDWEIDEEMSVRAISKISQKRDQKWEEEDLQLLREFPSGVTPTVIDTIDKKKLGEKWEELKEAEFSMPVLRSAWNKLKANYTLKTVDCEELKTMGRMFYALSMKEINSIPDESLGDCMDYLSRVAGRACDAERKICDKMWNKIGKLSQGGDSNRTKSKLIRKMDPDFVRFVPTEDLKNMTIDDLGGIDNIAEMDLDESQAEAVMEVMEKEKGPVSKDNRNYSGHQIKKLGGILAKGASAESLENLPEGTELLDSLSDMKKNMKSMKDEKRDAVYGKIHKMFGMDSNEPVCLDESTIKQTAGFFTRASAEDLNKLNEETRKSVLSEIGKDDEAVNTMSRKGIRTHFRVLKENLDNKDAITDDDVRRYGPNLLCGMEEGDVAKLSKEALQENIAEIDKCDQLDQKTRKEVADKFVSNAGGMGELLKKPEKLKSMGSLSSTADMGDPSTFTKDQKDALRSVAGDVMSEVNKRKKRLESRGEDVPSSEKTEEQFLRGDFARKVWDSVSDGADCPTIQSFDGDLEFLDESDIDGLSSDVVAECLGEFQGIDWNGEQLDKFCGKMKQSFGDDTGTWSKDRVMRAGKLITCLESDDIDKLTLDEDVIGVIGQREVKEPKKMFKKFAEDAGIANASDVDSDTLIGMGSVICGMEASEMKHLPKDVIKNTIGDLNSIACLDDDQKDVIGKKYEESITADELDVEKMGAFVGRLGEDKLKTLDDDQLSRISKEAMKNMKPETFAKSFSSDKVSKMSKEQVTALDPKVLRKMDVSQLIALENVAKGKKNVDAAELARNKTEEFFIEIPDDVEVKSLETFQEVRNLPADNCGGVSFEGQADSRLDTPTKRHEFNQTLREDRAEIFTRLVASQDHDVSQFTTFEMRKMLKHMARKMDEEGQNAYINLKTEFSSLTSEELNDTLQTLPPNLYLLMKPRLMCDTLGQMDVESLDTFCERLTSTDVTTGTFIEILNRCGDCLAVANAHKTDDGMIELMNGFKGKAFYDKLRQWKATGWDIYHLMFAPDSLEVEDIDRITNLDHFKDIGQIVRLADPRFYENVPKPVMKKLARMLHRALGPFSEWSFVQTNMLLPYILHFPSNVLEEEMTVTTVLSILTNIEEIMEVASNRFMSVSAWKITDYLVKKTKSVPKDIKKKVFCLVLKYTNHKKLWRRVYSTSEIFECLPSCRMYDISEEAITNLIRRVVKSKSFTWDQEGFDVLGDFISAVPLYKLKDADPTLLFHNWDAVSNLDFSFGKLRSLWKIISDKVRLNTMTCSDIKHLGRALLVLHSKDIEKIPEDAMGECAPYIGRLLQDTCSKRRVLCRTLWKKVKDDAETKSMSIGSVVKDLGKGFLQYIPKKDIKAIDIDDLGGVDNLSHLEPSVDQAPILMRKVKEKLGAVTKENTNYTADAVMKMGPTFFFGATGHEFEILPEDMSLLEMLPHMAAYFDNLNEKKIEIVFQKLKKLFAVDDNNDICLDRALAEQIAMFFTAARADDLRKFNDDTRKVIFQAMGGKYKYINKMSRSKIQELFSVLMETDSLGSRDTYDDQDVGNYKYMWCGQKASQAKRLSKEAVDGHMSTIKDCVHLEPDTRESLVQRSITISVSLSELLASNPKRLEDLGSLIIDIDVDTLKALDSESQEIFIASTKKLMESATEVQKEAKKRPSADISKNEKQKDETKLKNVGRTIFNMYVTLEASESRRKKRSTPAVDCPTIQSFNGALSFLTAEEIGAMDNDEFQDCLAEFQSTEWDDDQLDAFQTQLVTSFGSDTSTWTQANVLACGVLLDSLDADQITNLEVLDDDTVSSLGSAVFTKNAPYIMDTYMETESIEDLSSLDSDTLGNVGNLVCGFNTSQMAGMESSTIDGASGDLGSVSCLSSDQLTTMGNKIVEIRGTDWSDATADDISSLGVLAGGLPASVLEDIGTDELSSLAPEAVESMDPDTFANVFTADKISSLSSAQANSLTDEQRAQLSDEQLSAVSYIATTTTAEENGAQLCSSNLWTAFIFVIVTFIVQTHH